MQQNNEALSTWVKAAVETHVEDDTNGGTIGYMSNTWGEQMEGEEGNNPDLLLGGV